jgi:hypothetical protein
MGFEYIAKLSVVKTQAKLSAYVINATRPVIVDIVDSCLPTLPSALLHKGSTSNQGAHLSFTFYLQTTHLTAYCSNVEP